MYAILFSKQSLFSNIVIFYLAKIGFMLNKIVWHSECYIKYSIGRDKISKIPQYTEDHILRKKMEGKNILRSIFVAWLVLNFAKIHSEASFISCMHTCLASCVDIPYYAHSGCTFRCVISCINSDKRITTKAHQSCSLACANSACSHSMTNMSNELGNSFSLISHSHSLFVSFFDMLCHDIRLI